MSIFCEYLEPMTRHRKFGWIMWYCPSRTCHVPSTKTVSHRCFHLLSFKNQVCQQVLPRNLKDHRHSGISTLLPHLFGMLRIITVSTSSSFSSCFWACEGAFEGAFEALQPAPGVPAHPCMWRSCLALRVLPWRAQTRPKNRCPSASRALGGVGEVLHSL